MERSVTFLELPIWVWLVFAGTFIGLPATAIGTAILLRARATSSALRTAGAGAGPAGVHSRRVKRSGLAGLGIGILAGLILIQGEALLAVACCAGGYLAGLLIGEFAAQPPASGPLRVARLLVRRPADYVPRWAVAAALLIAVLVLAAPIVFALAPTVHYTSWHPEVGVSVTLPGGQTSWPPVFPDAIAAAMFVVAVLGAGCAGLRRVAARPIPADEATQPLDDLLRRQAGRAILGAVLGLELIVLALLLISASQALAVPVSAASPGAYLGGRVMVFAGLGCAAAGLAAWLILSGWTRRQRHAGSPPSNSVADTQAS